MKTTQLKNDSGRVKKGMVVGTTYLDLLVLAGHCGTAGKTANSLCRFDSPLLLLFAGGPILFLSTIHPQKDRTVIYQLHGSKRQ